MPVTRVSSRRRRSSHGLTQYTPVKPGHYAVASSSQQRPVTFAPNITPGTYIEEETAYSLTSRPDSPTSQLFPPSQPSQPAPARRRQPPGKRRSMGYIPRPPNAFMLFRADFVRQKHVPGSIETNHSSLSKIIGNCWRSLPLDEKSVWEHKAKIAKAEHKVRYPEYRFRPVHTKNKDKTAAKKVKAAVTAEAERRCEDVAQLLLEGKKGDELLAAVRDRDDREGTSPYNSPYGTPPHIPTDLYSPMLQYQNNNPSFYPPRRSSSVPLPNDHFAFNGFFPVNSNFSGYNGGSMALPSLPFMGGNSRPTSPVGNISSNQRMIYGQRRASSARPASVGHRGWGMDTDAQFIHREPSPLPDVDTSLFEPSFFGGNGFSFSQPQQQQQHQYENNISPVQYLPNNFGPSPLDMNHASSSPYDNVPGLGSSSSTYSGGSPAHSDASLPTPIHAPQPHHLAPKLDVWSEYPAPQQQQQRQQQQQYESYATDYQHYPQSQQYHEYQPKMENNPIAPRPSDFGVGLGLDFNREVLSADELRAHQDRNAEMNAYNAPPTLDSVFGQPFGAYNGFAS